ncbi:hypothetical protein [Nonomuraea sp. NEAU-A123]|uniref:hypothetical protein n=1 Tax=Nonomuraea sp. NEAU-A123 TaxID=2839649 RepID=UPI001BE48B56|nr:hypothetical protein [Nonomuraea sp. NEAU-A123]MBT2227178.1 hypothetical protein [Nonomuraea sp. NEAU-A123]
MTATLPSPATWADRTGRALMAVDAVATLVAFAGGVMNMVNASDDRLMVEGWRTFGYLVFAGMWAMLALRPRRHPGFWELILLQKILVTIWAFAIGAVPEAQTASFIDLGLVVTTILAYVLCRGWYAWRTTLPTQPVGVTG